MSHPVRWAVALAALVVLAVPIVAGPPAAAAADGGELPVLPAQPAAAEGGGLPVLPAQPAAAEGGELPVLPAQPAAAEGGELTVPTHDGDDVDDAIEDILARPDLREEQPNLLERARNWVFEQLGRGIDALFQSGGGTLLGWVVVVVAIGLAVVFTVRLGRGVQRDPGISLARGDTGARRTAADWRADAEANEAAGRWRAAVRCRYRALVADLAERGLIDDVPGRTAGEHRREVEDAVPAAAHDFTQASELFERAWYGNRPTGRDDTGRLRQLTDRVLTGVGR